MPVDRRAPRSGDRQGLEASFVFNLDYSSSPIEAAMTSNTNASSANDSFSAPSASHLQVGTCSPGGSHSEDAPAHESEHERDTGTNRSTTRVTCRLGSQETDSAASPLSSPESHAMGAPSREASHRHEAISVGSLVSRATTPVICEELGVDEERAREIIRVYAFMFSEEDDDPLGDLDRPDGDESNA